MLQLWNGHNNMLKRNRFFDDDFLNSFSRAFFNEDINRTDMNYTTTSGPESCVIEIDLPGVKREDIDLNVEGNLLTVSAKRKQTTLRETFKVRNEFDVSNIDARLELGVLTLIIPRAQGSKPQKISIK